MRARARGLRIWSSTSVPTVLLLLRLSVSTPDAVREREYTTVGTVARFPDWGLREAPAICATGRPAHCAIDSDPDCPTRRVEVNALGA